jgi:hypothetical protein
MRVYLSGIKKLSDLLVIDAQLLAHKEHNNDCGTVTIIDFDGVSHTRFSYLTTEKTINDMLVSSGKIIT